MSIRGPQNTVEWGHSVILRFLDGRLSSLDVVPGKTFRFGRRPSKVDGLVGLCFGKSYEVLNEGARFQATELPEAESTLAEDAGDGTNQFIVDDNQSQKLTPEDIQRMKDEGTSGAKIIQALVENSASFQSRTEFSREKYIRRKQKKYLNIVTILRPSIQLIQQVYFTKNPSRILSLREDSLAHMLSLSNVHAHSKVLVFDGCMGLLTAAVAERLGGYGEILAPHDGAHPKADIALMLNFPEATVQAIRLFPLSILTQQPEPSAPAPPPPTSASADPSATSADPSTSASADPSATSADPSTSASADPSATSADRRRKLRDSTDEGVHASLARHRPSRRFARVSQDAVRSSLRAGVDSLLIATHHDPCESLKILLPFLRSSGAFAVYCPFIQPLAESMVALSQLGVATKLELFESWLRHYQVLPNRTHPDMVTHAASGFVLSGIATTTTTAKQ